MRNGIHTTLFALGFGLLGLGAAAPWFSRASDVRLPPPEHCGRIVSLAPSVTETLFALGLGDRVVGVSRFCDYPPEAASRAVVGGYVDLNYEAVLAARPDLVVGLTEHRFHQRNLHKLGIPTLLVDHQSLEGVWESLETLDDVCGADGRGRRLAKEIRRRLDQLRQRSAGRNRPRVLLVLEREGSPQRVSACRVVGREGYFDRMIEYAGGVNACREAWVRYPMVSVEGLLAMAPEVIVDMSPAAGPSEKAPSDLRAAAAQSIAAKTPAQAEGGLAAWRSLPRLPAVRQGRVYALRCDFAFRPGPRVIETIEAIASLIRADDAELRPVFRPSGDN